MTLGNIVPIYLSGYAEGASFNKKKTKQVSNGPRDRQLCKEIEATVPAVLSLGL